MVYTHYNWGEKHQMRLDSIDNHRSASCGNQGRLDIGCPYPGKVVAGNEIELFAHNGTLLRVGMDHIQRAQAEQYRTGKLEFRLDDDNRVLVTSWKFGHLPWINASFDALLMSTRAKLEVQEVYANTRLLVDVHLVDTQTRIVKALRAIMLSFAQTEAIRSAVKKTISYPLS